VNGSQCGADLRVTRGRQPTASADWLSFEPGSQDLDEEDVAQSAHNEIGAGPASSRFAFHVA
jgi:hypothetical protein